MKWKQPTYLIKRSTCYHDNIPKHLIIWIPGGRKMHNVAFFCVVSLTSVLSFHDNSVTTGWKVFHIIIKKFYLVIRTFNKVESHSINISKNPITYKSGGWKKQSQYMSTIKVPWCNEDSAITAVLKDFKIIVKYDVGMQKVLIVYVFLKLVTRLPKCILILVRSLTWYFMKIKWFTLIKRKHVPLQNTKKGTL